MFQIDSTLLALLNDPDFQKTLYPIKVLVCIALLFITARHLRYLQKNPHKTTLILSYFKTKKSNIPIFHWGFILIVTYALISTIISWVNFYQTV